MIRWILAFSLFVAFGAQAGSLNIPGSGGGFTGLADYPDICAANEMIVRNGTDTANVCAANIAGGAGTGLSYITQTAEGTLGAEFALGSLGNGLLVNTTGTGIPTIKGANTCTNQFARSDTASGVWTCATVGTADLAAAITTDIEWDTAAEINTATTDDDFVRLTTAQSITGEKTFTGPIIGTTTVAGLPSTAGTDGRLYVVTDAQTGGDCTTGAGSARALCRDNGGSWGSVGDGGGGGAGDITDVFSCASGDCSTITMADTDYLDMSGVTVSTNAEGLRLPGDTTCTANIANGQVCWDNNSFVLSIGNGSGVVNFSPGTSGPWSDADPIVPGTTTRDVQIGPTFNNAAKLSIDGDADQVQLSVQGNATQTTSPVVVETSAGADLFTINNAGNVVNAGTITSDGTGQSDFDGDVSAPSFTTDRAAIPAAQFRDSGATDVEVNAQIYVDCTDGGTGAEDCDMTLAQQEAGVEKIILNADADAGITIGSVNNNNLTIATDGTGNAEVLLPDDSIGPAEIDDTANFVFTTLSGKIKRNTNAINDNDCAGEQGSYWFDTTDNAFEFCNANSGTPTILGGGGGAPTSSEYLVSALDGVLSAEDLITEGAGIDYTNGTGTGTFALKYTDTLAADPALNADECVFTTQGAAGGGFLCEGSTGGNANEQFYRFPDVDTADSTQDIIVSGTTNSVTSAMLGSEVRSMVWGAGAMSADGTDCSSPAEVSIASGPKFYTVVCGMATSETDGFIYGSTVLPDSIDVVADAVFSLTSRVTTDNAGATAHGYMEIQCVAPDATVGSSWSGGANLDITQAVGDVTDDLLQDDSATVDLATCAADAVLYWRFKLCDTDATPSTGCTSSAGAENDHQIVALKMEYTSTTGD